MTATKTSPPLRVRIFVDFWNFTLLVRGADPRFQIDWKALGPALTGAVEELLAGRERCRFDGLHVVGSNDPSNRKDDSLKHWFLNTLPAFPGVETVLLERQKKRNPPACPVCRTAVPVCPACGANMRGSEEKGVDIRLATDLIRLAWLDGYDIAVLLSADKDFVPVAEFLKSRGLKIIHGGFPGAGNQVSRACWGRLDMKKLMPRYRRPRQPTRRP